MSHKDAPPETETQRAVREFYTDRLASRGITAGWGRGKDGQFLSEYARDAHAAWIAAQEDRSND
jgi:hypothetical protein